MKQKDFNFDAAPGFIYCGVCDKTYPALRGCPLHMTEKPVTLSRYDAKVFLDVADNLGITSYTEAEAIEILAGMIRRGEVFYSLVISTQEGGK